MYAQLCRRLCEDAPNFEVSGNSSISTFRRLLLNKCQDEFENRSRATEAFDKKDGPLTPEEMEQRVLAKCKMLGNIKFIGELGKLDMLHETILHKCVKQLLEKKKNISVKDMAEDLECLCQIMRTVGRRLDIDKAKAWMDQYFERMNSFMSNPELPSRIRFMLQDVIELRRSQWVPRKVLTDNGPRTIQQIREEAAKDYGYIPPLQYSRSGSQSLFSGPKKVVMADMFVSMPIGRGKLGTGPGVITMENFNGYSTNMGRLNRSGDNRNIGPGQGFSGSFILGNQSSQRSDSNSNYHSNRSNSSSQSQHNFGQGNKEFPPRFIKKSSFSGNLDEISLRPAQNSMMLKPQTPTLLPKSILGLSPTQTPSSLVQSASQQQIISQPLATLPNTVHGPFTPSQAQITIKQASQEKLKSLKQQVPDKEEFKKMFEIMLADYNINQDIIEAVNKIKEMKMPKKFVPELLSFLMIQTLDKTDTIKETVSDLLAQLKKDGQITSSQFLKAFQLLLEQLPELELDYPLVKSYVAGIAARAIIHELFNLLELAESMENGAHYPLFLLCLQQLHKLQDKEWLVKTFNNSKINLINMLPEADRNKERLMEIMEDRGLGFMFPLLRVQADLWKQIQADPSATSIYKWVKENVENKLLTNPEFIFLLTSNLMHYITQESTLGEDVDPNVVPDKALQEKEKDLLDKFKPIFQAFLQDYTSLHVSALYALQVHCYNNNFPKGMLLRWFVMLYDMEVIEEEAFLKWKEDVNDEYPGKGKSLFQVNHWLTWLEEAEEEDDEGGSDDDLDDI